MIILLSLFALCLAFALAYKLTGNVKMLYASVALMPIFGSIQI